MWALIAALMAYGAFCMPAPQGFGPAELAVALGLFAAIGPARLFALSSGLSLRRPGADMLDWVGSLTLLALLLLGGVRGIALGWAERDILRDVVPLGFLFLPLLLGPLLACLTPRVLRRLAHAFALAGLLFALRWWGSQVMGIGPAGMAGPNSADYLLNSATVPFAAVWLPLAGLRPALERPGRGGWVLAGLGLIAGLACLGALAEAVHRAALLLCLGALGIGFVAQGLLRPRLGLVLLLGLLAASSILGPVLLDALDLVARKTEAVGLNNRLAEVEAVLAQTGRSPVAFLLGDGWGALLSNPAVGYLRVSYTHSLASYLLLKVGAVGLVLVLAYLGLLAGRILAAQARRPDLLLAAGPSLLLGLFLHTSFKFLCFGLLLALLTARGRGG
ncbi:hypothetical protein HHL28_02730 [Aerophototrophica crusticola]|uniref:O-antigen ligase domain-containing protein n=1 Tax=Aerophototrophica crusticola TaxID=1709002 RepID=A0A858R452_9PROT|nr:hypothetical protein HHL28_02730 [Rhodospirillaceae bacterium B3]